MACYYPLRGWRSKKPNPSGKHGVTFKRNDAQLDAEIDLPCGRCIGCRLERSKVWAIRCVHEASLHDHNCFITLTYDNDNLPFDGSLNKKHWQTFMKNLRRELKPDKIRFYMCGEYGQDQDLASQGIDKIGRPHFHAIIFGFNPIDQADRVITESEYEKFKQSSPTKYGICRKVEKSHSNEEQFESSVISKSWKKGRARVSSMSFESAAYVARYCTKKIDKGITHEQEQEFIEHYTKFSEETGEAFLVEPEFTLMSRNPGIAKDWFEKYYNDIRKGYINVNGHDMSIPKYYISLMESDIDKELDIDRIKENKRIFISSKEDEYNLDRLRAAEHIKLKQTKQLLRE